MELAYIPYNVVLFAVAMADIGIKAGDCVLLVWAQTSSPETLKDLAGNLRAMVGSGGKLALENTERLMMCKCNIPWGSWV